MLRPLNLFINKEIANRTALVHLALIDFSYVNNNIMNTTTGQIKIKQKPKK